MVLLCSSMFGQRLPKCGIVVYGSYTAAFGTQRLTVLKTTVTVVIMAALIVLLGQHPVRSIAIDEDNQSPEGVSPESFEAVEVPVAQTTRRHPTLW